MAQTLRLAAKTAIEQPSENFVAVINPEDGSRQGWTQHRSKKDPNKVLADLVKMGVHIDQIVS